MNEKKNTGGPDKYPHPEFPGIPAEQTPTPTQGMLKARIGEIPWELNLRTNEIEKAVAIAMPPQGLKRYWTVNINPDCLYRAAMTMEQARKWFDHAIAQVMKNKKPKKAAADDSKEVTIALPEKVIEQYKDALKGDSK